MLFKGKLDLDSESDFVSICGSRRVIVDVAILINELSQTAPPIEAKRIEEVRRHLRAFRRTKPKAWSVGDVFAVPLQDILQVKHFSVKEIDDTEGLSIKFGDSQVQLHIKYINSPVVYH